MILSLVISLVLGEASHAVRWSTSRPRSSSATATRSPRRSPSVVSRSCGGVERRWLLGAGPLPDVGVLPTHGARMDPRVSLLRPRWGDRLFARTAIEGGGGGGGGLRFRHANFFLRGPSGSPGWCRPLLSGYRRSAACSPVWHFFLQRRGNSWCIGWRFGAISKHWRWRVTTTSGGERARQRLNKCDCS